jgi:hypothetical protein
MPDFSTVSVRSTFSDGVTLSIAELLTQSATGTVTDDVIQDNEDAETADDLVGNNKIQTFSCDDYPVVRRARQRGGPYRSGGIGIAQ